MKPQESYMEPQDPAAFLPELISAKCKRGVDSNCGLSKIIGYVLKILS